MCGKQRTCGRAFSDLWQWQDLRANFRKCGKERTYRIRNLEECATARKQRTEFENFRARSVCEDVKKRGARILKELEGPRGGGAWLGGHRGIVPD